MFSNNSISIRLFNGYFIIIIFLGIIAIVSLVKLGSINYLKKSLMDNYTRIKCISNLEINKEKLITKTRIPVNKGNEQEVAEDCLNILNNMRNEALKLTSICMNNPLLLRLNGELKSNIENVACSNSLFAPPVAALATKPQHRVRPAAGGADNSVKSQCNILFSEYQSHIYPDNRMLLPGINNFGVVISALKKEGYKDIEKLQDSFKGVIQSAFMTL